MASTTESTTPFTMNFALVSGAQVDVGKTQSKGNKTASLTQLLEQYASDHPNPRLEEEHQQCEALLQQVAQQEVIRNPSLVKKQKSGGLFGFFFSKRARHDDDDNSNMYDTSLLHPDEWLEYYMDHDNDDTESSLCDSTLDTSCIPQEAYSIIRFFALCRRRSVNVASPLQSKSDARADNVVTLVSLGVLCELNSETGEGTVIETSDKHELQEHVGAGLMTYNVNQARAAMLGDGLVAISWGFHDGWTVLYQRQQHGWESIAVISPTRAVSDNIQHDDSSSFRLLVTDLVVMQVQDPMHPPPSNDGLVTALVISRLGGFIEFIIVPSSILDHTSSRTARPHVRHKRKRASFHYAADLVNISYSDTGMTALTTMEYHVDVVCLQVHRTSVGSDTEWDTSAFKTPPAEYVLVASGGTPDEQQVLSFWAVSIVFPDVGKEPPSIHVAFLDGIHVGRVGPDATLFCTDKMWQEWRKPRQVRLRDRQDSTQEVVGGDTNDIDATMISGMESKRVPISTLSAAMPIVQIRVKDGDSKVVLAALDGNGGVAFVDCTTVIALAAHDVTEEELGDESLVTMKYRLPSKSTSATVDIGWLDVDPPSKVGDEVFYEDGASPFLSLVAIKPRMLQVVNVPLSSPSEACVSYSLNLPSLSDGASIAENGCGQSILFLALRPIEDKRNILCQANLERLDSSTAIAMLAKAGKYEEAIAAAETMGFSSSSDTIQSFRKRLWEENGDVQHLAAVMDDEYVVSEALSIFNASMEPPEEVDLANARAACLLALERIRGAEDVQEITLRLEAVEAKVSTYILLCMSKEAVPDFTQFRDKFLPVSLPQLACAFASTGDFTALTMIMFRHRPELLPCQLEILDCIPLETPPESFAHLLPVWRPGKAYFHTGEHGANGFHQWSMMTYYMENTHDIRLLLDDKDGAAILDRCRLFDAGESPLRASSIRKWYLTRVKRIQSELGSISLLRHSLELASLRLDVSLDSLPSEQQMDPDFRELTSLQRYVTQLNRILTVSSSSEATEKLVINALATMSLSEIGDMNPEDRVALILGPPNDPGTVISKFRNGSLFLSLGEPVDDRNTDCCSIDESVLAYCRSAISNAIVEAENGSSGIQHAVALRNALDVCTEIANASRTTIRRLNRVVKNKSVLMDLVLGTAYGTSRACKRTDVSPSDCRHMVDSIWESYECLPIRSSPEGILQEGVQVAADFLYKNLVVVDIFSRWSPSALKFLVDLNVGDSDDSQGARLTVGLTMLTEICRSFCHQVSQVGHPNAEAEVDLLADLTSDVDQINKVSFSGGLPMTRVIQEHLVKPLLEQQKFHLIGKLSDWRDKDEIQATVLAFVNETMFNDGNSDSTMNGDRIQAAIGCQDVLGPFFPDLQDSFTSSRRYLDAASVANRMMTGNDNVLLPCEVRDRPPLDIVESLLRRNPGCIFDGCGDWMDPSFSRNANNIICRHYLAMEQGHVDGTSLGASLPVLPGSAIYHLASLLGLQGPHALLVVKARVVCHAILIAEFAAAAAVCATMAFEKEPSWDEPAVAECIVDAVARVVSLNDYDDVQMKLALCSAVFKRDRGTLSVLDFQAYETVLDSFVTLDNIKSHRRRQQESTSDSLVASGGADQARGGDDLPTVNDFLVFRAVGMVAKTAKNVARHQSNHQPENQSENLLGPPSSLSDRVYQDILAQYSTDMRELFWILRGVSASSKVDDPLLLTLGRLLGFWCIADALRIRPQSVPLGPERADLDDVLSLGTSLLLHTQDREELVSCVGELQGILARETVATMERAASTAQPDSVTPDPEIVKTLISRGYSENGARRAAVMTGNESAQVALVWAVSHTLDEGFDDPMISVASLSGSSDSGRVDQSMVHCLQETLNLANSYVSRKQSLQSLLPATLSSTKLVGTGRTKSKGDLQNGHGQKLESIGHRQATKSPTVQASDDMRKLVPTVKPPTKAETTPVAQKPIKANMDVPSVVANGETTKTRAARLSVGPPNAAPSKLAAHPPPPPMKSSRTSLPAETRGNGSVPTTSANKSKLAVPASSAPRSVSTPATSSSKASTSVDRLSTLQSQDKNKSTGTTLAGDERQRLIAEGRRMLREARASRATTKASVPSAPSANTFSSTTSSRYPLRSRTTASSSVTATAATAGLREENGTERATTPPAKTEDTSSKKGDDDDDGWDFDDF